MQPPSFKDKVKKILPFSLIPIILIILYLFLSGKNARQVLNPFQKSGVTTGGNNSVIRGEVMSPLTGVFYMGEDAASWIDSRPIGVMVNNHISARPQAGLGDADIIYEIVAEGGITRFLSFFHSKFPQKAGPIRSTREYYLVIVKELADAAIMHIGWSPQALQAIESWPVRSLGRAGLNCEQVLDDPKDEACWRDMKRVSSDVAWEHTAFGNVQYLNQVGKDLGWGGTSDIRLWEFKEDSAASPTKCAEIGCEDLIQIDFWYKGDYTGMFKYDMGTNTYRRYTGFDENDQPKPTIDLNTGEQVRVKNLIIQFVPEQPIAGDDKNRLTYELEGSGQALIMIDGRVIDATWTKAGRDERTVFYDTNGEEIAFNRGNFWISIVSDANMDQVVY